MTIKGRREKATEASTEAESRIICSDYAGGDVHLISSDGVEHRINHLHISAMR
jgi:hypothetical protein